MCEASMKIALVQARCALGDKDRNIATMKKALSRYEADLFVFCELYLSGYMVRDQVHGLAEGLDGRSVAKISELAEENGCGILFGMARQDDDLPGVIRNSAVLVSDKEGVQFYDKMHPATFGPFEEGLYFAKGHAPTIMELNGTRFGTCICYDVFHSEMARAYALGGAEALICISASPYTSRSSFERLLPARALENTLYSVYVNQVGTQLNLVFFGGSQAYGPSGDQVTKLPYFEEGVQSIEIDRDDLVMARRARPTIRDGSDLLIQD
jgi:predicted amidohydrolase